MLTLCACDADVLLGYNQALSSADAGDAPDAGQLTDGGLSVDAGLAVDAGFSDAGLDGGSASVDGGPADSGTDSGVVDAGTADAGASADSGAGDAGPVDAGSSGDAGSDAGAPVDAGPANFSLQITGPLVLQQGDPGTWRFFMFNDGGLAGQPDASVFTTPAGFTFQSGMSCADAGGTSITCTYPLLFSLEGATSTATLIAGAGFGWHDLTAQFEGQSQVVSVSVTGIGNTVVPLTDGGYPLNIDACFGTSITSYSQCTPGSLISAPIILRPDGTIDSLDAGYLGIWGQSPHFRNLGFRFLAPNGNRGTSFSGFSVSPLCFEGVINNPAGTPFTGAWRGCLN